MATKKNTTKATNDSQAAAPAAAAKAAEVQTEAAKPEAAQAAAPKGQPQAMAVLARSGVVVDLDEFLKHAVLLVLGNAGAGIAHLNAPGVWRGAHGQQHVGAGA